MEGAELLRCGQDRCFNSTIRAQFSFTTLLYCYLHIPNVPWIRRLYPSRPDEGLASLFKEGSSDLCLSYFLAYRKEAGQKELAIRTVM